jgi:hypothetical protein
MDLQMMREARDSYTVTLMNYLKNVNKTCLMCFFEGKDDRYYYVNLIDRILNEKFVSIACCGKDNLIYVLQLIEEDRSKEKHNLRVMFFLDGDFSNKIKYNKILKKYSEDLYILDAYSFENFYCSLQCFEKIMVREFGIDYGSEALDVFKREYQDLIINSENTFKILNNCFYIIREIRYQTSKQVNFDKLDAVKFNQKNVSVDIVNYSYDSIANHYNLTQFTNDEIAQAEAFFKDKQLEKFGRGHNQIQLVYCYFKKFYKLNKDKKLKVNNETVQYSCHIDIGNEIIEHCEYAAEKPKDLIRFIEAHRALCDG